jgi:hypothetical protein
VVYCRSRRGGWGHLHTLAHARDELGFDQAADGDALFPQLVPARIPESASRPEPRITSDVVMTSSAKQCGHAALVADLGSDATRMQANK